MRTIDADELKEWFFRPYSNEESYSNIEVARRIDAAPTVDQWHYPSRGEYPTEKELVLMKIPGCYALGWFRDNKWFFDMKHDQFTKLDVLRWQYIKPPKEEA